MKTRKRQKAEKATSNPIKKVTRKKPVKSLKPGDTVSFTDHNGVKKTGQLYLSDCGVLELKEGISSRLSRALNASYPPLDIFGITKQDMKILDKNVSESIKQSFNNEIKIPDLKPKAIKDLPRVKDKFEMISPATMVAIHDTDGSICRIEAGDISKGVQSYLLRSQNNVNGGGIPSIPKYNEKVEFNADYRKGCYWDVLLGTSEEPSLTEFHAARDEFKLKLEQILEAFKIQGSDGNWNASPYMYGMFNGMELIVSILKDRPVQYRDNPFQSKEEDDRREKSPAELINEFLKGLHGKEELIPTILQDVVSMIMKRVKDDAERKVDASAVARKRFEECLGVLDQIKSK